MQTNDYNLFKISEKNRKIQGYHVEKIKKSINEVWYLKYNPIIIDENFEIIDWQHRYFACVQLWLPIHYEMEKWNVDEVMKHLNSTQKEWLLTDYIDFYASKWYEWYIYYNEFKTEYKFNQTATLAVLCSNTSSTWTKIKAGMNFEKVEYADFIAKTIMEFWEDLDFAKSRAFIKSIIRLYLKGGKVEVAKLMNRALRIKKQVNLADYCTVFENLLNKGRNPENFISL